MFHQLLLQDHPCHQIYNVIKIYQKENTTNYIIPVQKYLVLEQTYEMKQIQPLQPPNYH